jgi:hypothetical protein
LTAWFVGNPNSIDSERLRPLLKQGAGAARTLRAEEALPMFAVTVGASLVRTDERIAPADGVGAVLRYAPTLDSRKALRNVVITVP